MEQSQIQRILEAILFASGERMEITRLMNGGASALSGWNGAIRWCPPARWPIM